MCGTYVPFALSPSRVYVKVLGICGWILKKEAQYVEEEEPSFAVSWHLLILPKTPLAYLFIRPMFMADIGW